MGKATYKGLVPRDDPMFSTGPEVFSLLGSSESSSSSQKSTSGETPVESSSAVEPLMTETEEDGFRAQELRIAKLYRNDPKTRDEILAKIRAARKT
jgi:hypothetical protein